MAPGPHPLICSNLTPLPTNLKVTKKPPPSTFRYRGRLNTPERGPSVSMTTTSASSAQSTIRTPICNRHDVDRRVAHQAAAVALSEDENDEVRQPVVNQVCIQPLN